MDLSLNQLSSVIECLEVWPFAKLHVCAVDGKSRLFVTWTAIVSFLLDPSSHKMLLSVR